MLWIRLWNRSSAPPRIDAHLRYERVNIQTIGYHLPPAVITSGELDNRLAPLYQELGLGPMRIEDLTGIRERRVWDAEATMAAGSIKAGFEALGAADLAPGEIDILVYAGVCRDNLEPATACAVAEGLGLGAQTEIFDLSNACLGVMNGMIRVADAIELGRIGAGLIVACESSRPVIEATLERMLTKRDMETFRKSIATMTGGSGAVAVLLTDASCNKGGHKLLGGMMRAAPEFHRLCRWGSDGGMLTLGNLLMETDAASVLKNGVELGVQTWRAFLHEMGWTEPGEIKTVGHQVGAMHRQTIMDRIGVPLDNDFATFEYLGNIGTVSLPITAAIADERAFLQCGDRVCMMGIGSGLNCLMLGVEW